MGLFIFDLIIYLILALVSFIDLRTFKIPNLLVLTLLAVLVFRDLITDRTVMLERLGFAVIVLIILLIIRYFTKGMGLGDIKLLTVLAYGMGFWNYVIMLLFASTLGIVTFIIFKLLRREIKKIPFAPFISVGFVASSFTQGLFL